MPRGLFWLPLLAAVLLLPGIARAQADQCDPVDLPDVEEVYERVGNVVYVQGPFLVKCTNGAELRANQGTVFEDRGEIHLVGNVTYHDPDRSMTADQATYSRPNRRLYATGDVVFTNRLEGTTIRGPVLEYFAEMPGRPEAEVIATGRPHLTLQPKQGQSGEPLDVDADRLTIVGDRNLTAIGSVVMRRPDLEATAGEARYDGDLEFLELRHNAVMRGEENTLRGEYIRAQLADDELREVHAHTRAVLESDDLTLTAPDLQIFFQDGGVERTVARMGEEEGAEQPVALSTTFRLVADSIDAVAPGQRLEQVTAIGRARGESVDTTRATVPLSRADTGALPDDSGDFGADPNGDLVDPGFGDPLARLAARPDLIEADWIMGDTVIAQFVQKESPPTELDPDVDESDLASSPDAIEDQRESVELERIIARGAAKSLYRMERDGDAAGNGSGAGGRGINFVGASEITIFLRDGQMDSTLVSGDARGVYLDPSPEASAPPGFDAAPEPAETVGAGSGGL